MERFQYMIKIRDAFKDLDPLELRKIANEAIKEASLESDKDLAEIAVLAYALSKILSKLHFRKREDWKKFEKEVGRELAGLVGKSKMDEVKDICGRLIELVNGIDESAGNYAKSLVSKARVKMASTAYALGLSLGTAASLTGANKYELARYIGMTKIHDRPFTKTLSARERHEIIRRVLRVKY